MTLLSSAVGATPGARTENGVRTVRLRAWGGLERRFGVPFPLFTPWLLVAALREVRRAEIVHIHDPLYLSSWAAALASRLTRTPYVVHRHVGFVDHPSRLVRLVQSLVLETFGRLVLSGSSVVLSIDEHVARTARRIAPEARVHVLGNGVDTTLFRPPQGSEREAMRRELGLPLDMPLLLFVGRFVPKKGFAQVVATAGDGHRVLFAGGDRPPAVDDERLVFLGVLSPEQLARVYRCVDAFVVASTGECPLTVLEAMSSALPVLANDDPALRSPWTPGPGVRFVDVAAGDLPQAVVELLADLVACRDMGEPPAPL